ncbi:hypothetical protein [Zeimonas arvi]|uniref:Uncharacterized protein n=1 Tax=Zeimonas arvi TaxID=2498847 RepID=A0A5C8NQP4_9BURK|nr:hypothetical protein [Zeimonas arvi]TXL63568.1 hypothetical protein FHP08_17180 [Zeimonas arvi]
MKPMTDAQRAAFGSIRWARGALTGVESPHKVQEFTDEQRAIRRVRQRIDESRDAALQLPDPGSDSWFGLR